MSNFVIEKLLFLFFGIVCGIAIYYFRKNKENKNGADRK